MYQLLQKIHHLQPDKQHLGSNFKLDRRPQCQGFYMQCWASELMLRTEESRGLSQTSYWAPAHAWSADVGTTAAPKIYLGRKAGSYLVLFHCVWSVQRPRQETEHKPRFEKGPSSLEDSVNSQGENFFIKTDIFLFYPLFNFCPRLSEEFLKSPCQRNGQSNKLNQELSVNPTLRVVSCCKSLRSRASLDFCSCINLSISSAMVTVEFVDDGQFFLSHHY